MPLLPLHLFKKFKGTDAKGLVSLHGLAALNIYLEEAKMHHKLLWVNI